MFVDSHCHLNYAGLAERQQEVLDSARAAGVSAMLNISTRAAEWEAVLSTAEREPDVWASVGIHPHDADTHEDIETALLVESGQKLSENLFLGSRNLDGVELVLSSEVHPYDLLRYEHAIFSQSALETLQETLKKNVSRRKLAAKQHNDKEAA